MSAARHFLFVLVGSFSHLAFSNAVEPLRIASRMFVFRAKRADRLKMLYWDGTGLVMSYKRLEETIFTWPAIRDGLMALNHAQFEALFAGLDWRKVKALAARPPAAAE